jgi:hypothetical protein
MQENVANLFVHLLTRPIGMQMTEECRLVVASSPVKPMRDAPALLWRHPAQRLKLFRAGLFVR